MTTTTNPRSRSRRATVLAAVAASVAGLLSACSAAPEPIVCEPIRVVANHGLTTAQDLGTAVAAVRLAYPDRAVEVIPFHDATTSGDIVSSEVVVNTVRFSSPPTAPSSGAVSVQHEGQVWVQLSPFDDFSPTSEQIAEAILLQVPACEPGAEAAR